MFAQLLCRQVPFAEVWFPLRFGCHGLLQLGASTWYGALSRGSRHAVVNLVTGKWLHCCGLRLSPLAPAAAHLPGPDLHQQQRRGAEESQHSELRWLGGGFGHVCFLPYSGSHIDGIRSTPIKRPSKRESYAIYV